MRKLKKQNMNYHESIAKNKSRIQQAELDIEQNQLDQEAKKGEIEAHKLVVKEVRDRLNTVRAGKGE